jgi:hypothetical protein
MHTRACAREAPQKPRNHAKRIESIITSMVEKKFIL